MRKEIYDSLFNKTAETMTSEDYRMYKDILEYRIAKPILIGSPIAFFIASFGMGGVVWSLGVPSLVFILSGLLAVGSSLIFTGFSSLLFKKTKEFMKKEFTKEDLRLMKKEKIYKQIKERCKAFEKTEKHEQFKRDERMRREVNVGESKYFEYEEQIAALQEKQNELNQTLEGLRQAQKREKSRTEVGKVFTDFEDTDDDTKGL